VKTFDYSQFWGGIVFGHGRTARTKWSEKDATSISKSERKHLRELLKVLDRRHTALTVSEVDRFMRTSLMVNFLMEGEQSEI
jgi:hypothetical protein